MGFRLTIEGEDSIYLYFPNAFVVDYFDLNSSKANVGRFNLFIKQKKDKNDLIKIDGGYAAD